MDNGGYIDVQGIVEKMKKPIPIPTADPDENSGRIEMIGKTLGHYDVTSQLGKNGMGEDYRAKSGLARKEKSLLPRNFVRGTRKDFFSVLRGSFPWLLGFVGCGSAARGNSWSAFLRVLLQSRPA